MISDSPVNTLTLLFLPPFIAAAFLAPLLSLLQVGREMTKEASKSKLRSGAVRFD